MENILGEKVKIIVNRPMGTYHPKYKEFFYPINCGYIDEFFTEDGEKKDVYILGVEEAVKDFRGTIIALIHRKNDAEEKWVAAPDGVNFTKEEIAEEVYFQEQYYDSEIIMK